MRRTFLSLVCLLVVLGGVSWGQGEVQAQAPTMTPEVILSRPRDGEALQGIVIIEGRVRGEDLRTLRLRFTDHGEQEGSWFYLSDVEFESGERSQYTFQVEWDTAQITDGNYTIRARAVYDSGASESDVVTGVRIRNYSPIETLTPRPLGTATATAEETPEGVKTPLPTPTPLPPNPAILGGGEILSALFQGLGLVVGLFVLYGMYGWIRERV